MQQLSLQQKAAVQHIKGPLLILAGAGCGKTSLLACKIAWLIRERGTAPKDIVALAATRSTVERLRRRTAELLGRNVPDILITTFAQFALRIILDRPEAANLRPGFSVYDRLESEALVGRLLREAHPDATDLAGPVWQRISDWKREDGVPANAAAAGAAADAIAARLYDAYHRRLRAANAIDLEDLARKAVEVRRAGGALAATPGRAHFLLLDEYERAGAGEHELVRLLAAEGAVVTAAADDRGTGQPAQWGTGVGRLPGDFPDLRVIRLEQNFRSTASIVKLANRLLLPPAAARPAPPARLLDTGTRARVLQARSEQHEAESLVAMLLDHRARTGAEYAQYAILLARPELAAPIEHALRTRRVPHRARGICSFFARTEIRDLWAYLRLLCNDADDAAFLRAVNTPRRDIDRAILERVSGFAAERGRALLECVRDPELESACDPERLAPLRAFASLIERLRDHVERAGPAAATNALLVELRYEEWLRDTCNDANIAARRMDNVARLTDMLDHLGREPPGARLRALMARLNLEAVHDPETDEGASDGVALMTLDAARGSEFGHVFLVGFDQPSGAAPPPRERHWAYIGVSRAREDVVFTVAEHRRAQGASTAREPSAFLTALKGLELEWLNADAGPAIAEPALAAPTRAAGGALPPR